MSEALRAQNVKETLALRGMKALVQPLIGRSNCPFSAVKAQSPNHWTTREFPDCSFSKTPLRDFPGGTVVKNPPANAGDMGSSPGLGRSHMPWSS